MRDAFAVVRKRGIYMEQAYPVGGGASVIWGVINDSFGFQTSIVCVIVCLIASYASAWIVYPARDKRWRH